MLRLLVVWLIHTVALLAVAYLLPGVAIASFASALVAALVLGLINAVIRPVLVLLTLPWAAHALPDYGPGPRGRLRAFGELPLVAALDAAEMAVLAFGSVRHRTLFL